MTSYQPGELVLVAFPFTGRAGNKLRPALVLLDSGDNDVVLARITTQAQSARMDVAITDWKAAGLLAPSIARLHKLATLEKTMIARRLGCLTATDRAKIGKTLEQLSSNW